MFRSGDEYQEPIRDVHRIYVNGEQIVDVTPDPIFKPIVDLRARIYEMAHQETTRAVVTYADPPSGELKAIDNRLQRTQNERWDKRRAAGLGPQGCRLLGERGGG